MGSSVVLIRTICFAVFLGWLLVWALIPTKVYKNTWTPKLNNKLNSTYFREQGNYFLSYIYIFLFPPCKLSWNSIVVTGTNLLLFSFPVMLIALLGCVYLHLQKKPNKLQSKRLQLSLEYLPFVSLQFIRAFHFQHNVN